MPKVPLKNTSVQPFIATMYHQFVGRYSEEKLYTVVRLRGPNGKLIAQKVPKSFQINANETLLLDEAVLRLPQVHEALKSGRLVKGEVVAAAPAVKAAPVHTTVPAFEEPMAPALAPDTNPKGKKRG